MRKTYFFSLSVSLATTACAQTLSPVSVGNSNGIFISAANKNLSYGVNHIVADSTSKHIFTGLSIDAKTNSLEVYPNPATDNLWISIQLPGEGKSILFLFDNSGKKIAEISAENNSTALTKQLDISTLPSGTYLLNLVYMPTKGGNAQTFGKKFQVIR